MTSARVDDGSRQRGRRSLPSVGATVHDVAQPIRLPPLPGGGHGVGGAPGRSEHELYRRAAGGDRAAREELAARWLPLARSLALRYRSANDAADDVLQVASLGLVKAIDGFDPDRGVAFSSYAVPTILGEIRRYFRDRTWVMRVPRSLQELSLRVDRATAELADELGREPTITEIARAVEAASEDVLEALQAAGARRPLSLDAPTRPCEDADTVGQRASVVEDGFDRVEQHTTLQAVLATATARERELLRMRFQQNMSQAEIAAVIGVSQMQISRILRQTLQRLYSVAHAGGAAAR